MKRSAAFLLAVVAALAALAAVTHSQDMDVYCGGRLSEALALACPNGLMVKRGGGEALPWLPAHEARSLGRAKRQVVYECCFKPCAMSELVAYCAP